MHLLSAHIFTQEIGAHQLFVLLSYVDDKGERSRITLALLSTGEAYVVDSRKEHRARVELCEGLSEGDDERARYATSFLFCDLR